MREARGAIGKQPLSVSDLSKAKSAIIQFSQPMTFQEEISMLEDVSSLAKKTSNIYRLDPVLSDNLLRVGRRLALPEELKHPALSL